MKLVNIGFGNLINADRVVAIISPESAPAKRMIQECKERAQLIDATHGRRTRAVIVTDSDLIVLTYLYPETVANRVVDDAEFKFSSADIKTVLDGVPLSEPSVMSWVEGYISEQTQQLFKN